MRRLNFSVLFVPLLASAFALVLTSAHAAPITKLVIFGDSISDPGNLYAASGGADPLSPPYHDGRFSNGPIWIDYLEQQTGLQVESHAYGGATSGTDNIANQTPGQYPGLQQQMQNWAAANAGAADPDALYFIWATGSNDLTLLSPDASPAELEAFVGEIISNLLTAVGTVYALGGQNVVIGNLPDLGLTPDARAAGLSTEISQLTALINLQLAAEIANLFAGAQILDTYHMLSDMIAHAADLGLTNLTEPCLVRLGDSVSICDDPGSYLFWDNVHPTTLAHFLFAEYFAASVLPAQVAEPPSVAVIGLGLLLLTAALFRRPVARRTLILTPRKLS